MSGEDCRTCCEHIVDCGCRYGGCVAMGDQENESIGPRDKHTSTDIDRLLEEVMELDRRATPGPWEAGSPVCCSDMGWVVGPKGDVCPVYEGAQRTHSLDANDAELIACYRTAAPKLAEELKRLREAEIRRHDQRARDQDHQSVLRAAQATLIAALEAGARELRHLTGQLLDAAVLPGHGLAADEWERVCLLAGRYCEPHLSSMKAASFAMRAKAALRAIARPGDRPAAWSDADALAEAQRIASAALKGGG